MNKDRTIRLLSFLLTLILACGTLPLTAMAQEPVTIRFTILDSTYDEAHFQRRAVIQRYAEMLGINFEFQVINAAVGEDYEEKLRILVAAGDYGDVIERLTDNALSEFAAAGIAIPLQDYVTPELMPNFCAAIEQKSVLSGMCTFPDGNMYTLPQNIEVMRSENFWIINTKWLDTLGLDVPTTTEALHAVLTAFKEQDPNGNGIADEVPLTLVDEFWIGAHLEAFIGAFGLAYKYGATDGYCTQIDGKAVFAPVTENYRDGMKYLKTLYQEGLLERELFTLTQTDYEARMMSATPTVGMTIYRDLSLMSNPDDYAVIAPVAAEGYDPVLWVNPAVVNGKRSGTIITDKNRHIEETLALYDLMFDPQENMYAIYGDSAYLDGDIVRFHDAPEGKTYANWVEETNFDANVPGILFQDDIGTKVELPLAYASYGGFQETNNDFFATEIWPRPMYTTEETERLAEIRMDIFNYVKTMKAKFITDVAVEVDAAWDDYLFNLERMNLAEYMEIQQTALDRYNGK